VPPRDARRIRGRSAPAGSRTHRTDIASRECHDPHERKRDEIRLSAGAFAMRHLGRRV
jgi:hypothetical protein